MQVLAEAGALISMVTAPALALIHAIGLVRGGPATIEVIPEAGAAIDAAGTSLPVDTVMVEVVPTTGQAWVLGLGAVLTGVAIAVISWFVYRTLRQARESPGPFRDGVASRLLWLALGVLAAWVLHMAVESASTMMLTPDGVGAIFTLNFLPLFVAGFLGVLARVFAHGQDMEHELKGLI